MSIFLEIMQLENGDVVLREARDESVLTEPTEPTEPTSAGVAAGDPHFREPLVRISFSSEVRDLLGDELIPVAEAMMDAATDYLDDGSIEISADAFPTPVVH